MNTVMQKSSLFVVINDFRATTRKEGVKRLGKLLYCIKVRIQLAGWSPCFVTVPFLSVDNQSNVHNLFEFIHCIEAVSEASLSNILSIFAESLLRLKYSMMPFRSILVTQVSLSYLIAYSSIKKNSIRTSIQILFVAVTAICK